jgi:hypothetical protein
MGNRDYGNDNALSSSEVSVSPGTGTLGAAIAANTGTGRTLVLQPGVYIDDWSVLSGSKLQIAGSGTGTIDVSTVSTAAVLEAGQTVIKPSNVPGAANATTWVDVYFHNIVFDLSGVPGGGDGSHSMIWGSNSKRLRFEQYSVLNALCQFTRATGLIELFVGRHTTSSDAPAGTTAGGIMTPTSMIATDVLVDGNFTNAHVNASPFGVNSFGGDVTGLTLGSYLFNQCKFFPGGQYFLDAALDFEFGPAAAGPRIQILGGEMWNSKCYMVNVPYEWIGGGFIHRVTAATTAPGPAMVIDAGTTGSNVNGILEIDGALSWYDDNATAVLGCSPINFSKTQYMRGIHIRSLDVIANGASTISGTEKNIPIYFVPPATASGTVLDELVIEGLNLGYTSLPTPTGGSYAAAVKVGGLGSFTVGKVAIVGRGIRFTGVQSAASGLPACVNPTTVGNAILLGSAAQSVQFNGVTLDGIDSQAATLATPTGIVPALYSLAGTPTFSRFFYGDRNVRVSAAGPWGGYVNVLKGQSSTIGTGALLMVTPPADGLFDLGLIVNIQTAGSVSMKGNATWNDEQNTASSEIGFVAAPGTGTAVAAGAITTAADWHPKQGPVWVKGGTALNLFLSGTTATLYDVAAYARQVA